MGGICSLLPYDTGICHYAFILRCFYINMVSAHSFLALSLFFPLHVSVCSYASVRARACVCLSMVVYIYILFTCVLYKTNCNVTSVRSYNV